MSSILAPSVVAGVAVPAGGGGHEHLDTPEALSQHPINHRGFYSPGRAQEGAGTRFLAGTDGLISL